MSTTSLPQFMFLLHQPHTGPAPSPEELDVIMKKFGVWMEQLRANGHVVGTNGLAPTGRVLRGSRGERVTDGPYAEAKEIVGGYILVQAADLDEAVRLARDCPGLDHRMAVEVRPVIVPPR